MPAIAFRSILHPSSQSHSLDTPLQQHPSNNAHPSNNYLIMLMQSFTLALMVAAASAFAPAPQQALRTSSSLSAIAPEKEIGVLAPIGFFE
jgi:hypothetical protein